MKFQLHVFAAATLACSSLAASATVVDKRSEDQKQARRDSNFSAIAFLPDKAIKPGPVAQLDEALRSIPAASGMEVELTEFRVLDVFPKRMRTGPGSGSNWLMNSLVDRKTDWAFLRSLNVAPDKDSVVCFVTGAVNGRQKSVAASAPYQLGGMSIMVRSDKNFRAATANCIRQLAAQLVEP